MRNVFPAILFFVAWAFIIVGSAMFHIGAALIILGLGLACLGYLLLER